MNDKEASEAAADVMNEARIRTLKEAGLVEGKDDAIRLSADGWKALVTMLSMGAIDLVNALKLYLIDHPQDVRAVEDMLDVEQTFMHAMINHSMIRARVIEESHG